VQMSKIEYKINGIIQQIDKVILGNKKFNISDTILIVGTPRSGTTWLMEILGTMPGYTYIFEPLNPIRSPPQLFELGFQSRTYLPFNIEWSEGENYLRNVFRGNLPGPPPLPKPKLIMKRIMADKLIVKSINLNRMLPWIAKRFQLKNIFFIIRHPCAVVASQLKTHLCAYKTTSSTYTNSFPTLKNILDEASQIEQLDKEIIQRLKRIKTTEEILAAAWCLDNYIPLSYLLQKPWITVIYEKLVTDGEKEIARFFEEMGEQIIPRSAVRCLSVPSVSTIWRERRIIGKHENEQLSKWKKSLSEKQIERILDIVSTFGLDFYTELLEPDYYNISKNIV